MAEKEKVRITVERSARRKPNAMKGMHAHEEYELYFLISGQRRYFIGHSIYDVAPGNLVLIPKGELHRTTSTGKIGFDRFVLYFHESDVSPLSDLLGKKTFEDLMARGCLELPKEKSDEVFQNLEEIHRLQEKSEPFSDAVRSHLLQNVLLIALRSGNKRLLTNAENADKIQEVARYITLHYQSHLDLQSAAQMAYMEESYFSKRFKQLTGFGFREFLIENRIRAAKELLTNTSLSVTEIAFRCGFSSGNYFGDCFRKWTDISPKEYRRKTQGK